MKPPARAKPPAPGAEPGRQPGPEARPAGTKAAPRAVAASVAKSPAKHADKPEAEVSDPAPGGMAEAQSAAPAPPALDAASSPSPPSGPVSMRRDTHPSIPPRQPSKPVEFKAGDHVVYPTHGVGTVQGIETMSAAGLSLQVIVVTFDENRMTLRVPVNKAASSGLRKLAAPDSMKEALDTLKGRARIKRTMWSRRAQEYEAKINSGDPVAIAEVVRDLHRNAGQPDQSFSERQIYEQAMDRLAAELAAIDRTDKAAATTKLLDHLKAG
ncbi:CarD family transcriptional regulator [Belnapia rosea]|uniref:Transcriptional regulator, CarD family n=1 Tax=Belnapia rosea TaxID=938405 RepID=A0A1G6UZ73_9PROT|nr:CarD family transcriptional regulator [Belnapia rosea]SDB72377.1 transcriptional regulator, CarD family [Belnapia rosea]SDD46622.1 transcriptional regulator, CarD family [Belnapia rosea]